MEKEKSIEKDLNYPLKLWVCTLAIGSLFSTSLLFFRSESWQDLTGLIIIPFVSIFWLLGFSFIFSLPALTVVWSLYRGIILFTNNVAFDKTMTVLLSIASVFGTQQLFLGGMAFTRPFNAYILAIPASALFLYIRLFIRNRKTKTKPFSIT